jgi:hypothetical protein
MWFTVWPLNREPIASVHEARNRAEKLDHAMYEVALRIHKSDRFTFIVPGLGLSQLVTLNPDIPKVPKLLREMNKKDRASA